VCVVPPCLVCLVCLVSGHLTTPAESRPSTESKSVEPIESFASTPSCLRFSPGFLASPLPVFGLTQAHYSPPYPYPRLDSGVLPETSPDASTRSSAPRLPARALPSRAVHPSLWRQWQRHQGHGPSANPVAVVSARQPAGELFTMRGCPASRDRADR
jgi:hypothetical protein